MRRRAGLAAIATGVLLASCSPETSAPGSTFTPPAAWGPVVDDKTDQWSGQMAGSTTEVINGFVAQYQQWSSTTRVEERSDTRAVLRFDYADVVRGMSREAGTTMPGTTKPLNRRLLIEVSPSGKDFVVRLRTFDIAP